MAPSQTKHSSHAATLFPADGTRPSAWQLIKPYWFSEDRHKARGLLVLLIAINLVMVYVNVQFNIWFASFYNALEKRDFSSFMNLVWFFAALAFCFIVLGTAQIYFRQLLEIRWRQWLTDVYLERWLHSRSYYRLERDHVVDNPDQRIAEDLHSMATNTLMLSVDLLSNLVTLFSFVTILWILSGALQISLFNHDFNIPGYLVWVAALYALLGSFIIHKVSRRLINIDYQQQKVEADFRVLLVRVRENAEQIAFYDGGPVEKRRARAVFAAIRQNWVEIMRYTKRLTFSTSIYGQIAIIFPIVAAAPKYFSGAFTLGVLMQLNNAFRQVSHACSWFITSYTKLAEWGATLNRLREFSMRMGREKTPERLFYHAGDAVRAVDLCVFRPDGQPLAVPKSFHIYPGERWLIRGPSGAGKSTLLRTLAGLWPHATGHLTLPDLNATATRRPVLFLPQSSYVPNGTLKETLCYPGYAEDYSDALCTQALHDCKLGAYVNELHVTDAWSQRLSPGEKQRLSFVRVLLLKPDYLFMDESTSSLDIATERALYETLCLKLPHTAIISVGHRDTLRPFHTHDMEIGSLAATLPSPPALPSPPTSYDRSKSLA